MKCTSVIINVPLSSPLHPKANLPFLSGFLKQHGYNVKCFDTNIKFFMWMLREHSYNFQDLGLLEKPVELLRLYNQLEEWLACKCQNYPGFRMDLRTIGFLWNRNRFADVAKATKDTAANPLIEFFDDFIRQELLQINPLLIGIGITFQDNIIPAFTLAERIRSLLPKAKIVFGGQMITRCYDNLVDSDELKEYWDYLALYDGEIPFLDLHRRVIDSSAAPMRNVIVNGSPEQGIIGREHAAFDLNNIESLDFSDINFSEYLFPEMLIPLQTARGCYGTCEFCAIPSGSNIGFRERSVNKIIRDIEQVQEHTQEKYGRKAEYFKFMDDTSAPKTLFGIAKLIEEKNLNAKWETYVRMEEAFQNLGNMELLFRGGCRKLMWGLETNSPEVLNTMNKKVQAFSVERVLAAANAAGILNFVFVLLGFPGENPEQRNSLIRFIVEPKSIHVLTVATFDVTKHSRIQKSLEGPNQWGLECDPAEDFEVRLPYILNGENWKKFIVSEAHRFMIEVAKKRSDIGLVSLFPDQVRAFLTDKHGNKWGEKFLSEFGEENFRKLLLATEEYASAFDATDEIELSALPDPLKREHLRTKEDIDAISQAIIRRKRYEGKRKDSI